MTSEVLLEKQRQLKERLVLAGQQVETLERLASSGHSIDKNAFNSARAGFISNIPSSRSLSGCKDSCNLFCRCAPDLYTDEKRERHELFMRYFDAKETAEKFISEVEQTSFSLPGVKRGYEVVRNQTQVKRQLHSEEVQLEIEL